MQTIEAQQQHQSQMSQQQAALQMQEINARTNLANARAEADRGLGLERATRVNENLELASERRAKAVEDRSDATLNQIKAIKELQDMDLDQIERGLRILQNLKGTQIKEEEEMIEER